MASDWTIAKDTLSFVGAIFVSVPWLFDFASRVALARFKKIPTSMRTLNTIVSHQEAWISAPKWRDLFLTSLGLMLLCASFGMALLQSLDILAS